MTMPVTGSDGGTIPIGDTSSTTSADDTGTASLLQPNTFLNLLVDELKYQDPLDPASSTDFMDQIAELSQVEQLQTVSSSSQMNEAASLMGQSVSGMDDAGDYITGTVTGITNSTSGPTLDVDGQSMSLAAIEQIGATSTTSS